MRKKSKSLHEFVMQKVLDLKGVIVTAREHPGSCGFCGGQMHVQKTFRHEGRTLAHGTFNINETVWVCAAKCRHPSGELVTRRADSVVQSIMPNSIIGYDLMVFIGLKRYLYHWQREDIRNELREKHSIKISTGEISRLTKLFLDYMSRLHYACAPKLKAAFEKDGGWPMHIDATGENGRGTLFVVMAGWKKWAIGSWKIATERSDLILPCLHDVVRQFGQPCAVMRDLGRAVTPAAKTLVEELDIDIPILACHQHFLADIGKDLLKDSHSELRELFRRIKLLPKIRELVRELGRNLGEQIDEARKAVQVWQTRNKAEHRLPQGRDGLAVVRSIAQWILDYKADSTNLDFPFDRPYLDLYNRCKIAQRAIDAFLRIPPEDQQVLKALNRLYRILESVSCEVPFLQIVRRISRRAELFDELRDQLRLASNMPEDESEHDINSMRENFEEWIFSLKERRPKRGPSEDTRRAIDIILKHVEDHGENLWGHIVPLSERAGGGVRLVVRTNERLENFFKAIKHAERRRSGRKILTQDLEHLPAEAVFVYNLNDEEYVNIVCGSLENLAKVFAQIDQNKAISTQPENLERKLQISTSSLSTADRRIIRTDVMNQRIEKAAKSRAPRLLSTA